MSKGYYNLQKQFNYRGWLQFWEIQLFSYGWSKGHREGIWGQIWEYSSYILIIGAHLVTELFFFEQCNLMFNSGLWKQVSDRKVPADKNIRKNVKSEFHYHYPGNKEKERTRSELVGRKWNLWTKGWRRRTMQRHITLTIK